MAFKRANRISVADTSWLFKNEFVDFQPMNVNFGLFKELPKNNARKLKKEIKKVALTTKAKRDWCEWMSSIN